MKQAEAPKWLISATRSFLSHPGKITQEIQKKVPMVVFRNNLPVVVFTSEHEVNTQTPLEIMVDTDMEMFDVSVRLVTLTPSQNLLADKNFFQMNREWRMHEHEFLKKGGINLNTDIAFLDGDHDDDLTADQPFFFVPNKEHSDPPGIYLIWNAIDFNGKPAIELQKRLTNAQKWFPYLETFCKTFVNKLK